MKKTIIFLSILLILTTLRSQPVLSLEKLTADQLKHTVAQSGVDISINDLVAENYLEFVDFRNSEDDPPHITFNGVHFYFTADIGGSDINDDGSIDPLRLNMGSYNNNAMLFANGLDLEFTTDINVDDIDFCGTHIGSMFVNDLTLSSFHLNIGPHVSTGVDFELGLRLKTDSLTYKYNNSTATPGTLIFSGVHVANAFMVDPDDSSKWIVDKTPWGGDLTETDQFRIGDLANNKPATVDFFSDSSTPGREGYIALNLPMKGSMRVESITFGGTNFGSVYMDKMNVEKLYIEMPGRGLGK